MKKADFAFLIFAHTYLIFFVCFDFVCLQKSVCFMPRSILILLFLRKINGRFEKEKLKKSLSAKEQM
ncbi:MAG: hypothetical protein ACOX7J_09145, partial [Bacillota bacterium]